MTDPAPLSTFKVCYFFAEGIDGVLEVMQHPMKFIFLFGTLRMH